MKLREELEYMPRTVAVIEATEESYADAVKVPARYFLEELDRRPLGWQPAHDSSNELGDDLYHAVRELLPPELREELSGGQVSLAAQIAYRAYVGD